MVPPRILHARAKHRDNVPFYFDMALINELKRVNDNEILDYEAKDILYFIDPFSFFLFLISMTKLIRCLLYHASKIWDATNGWCLRVLLSNPNDGSIVVDDFNGSLDQCNIIIFYKSLCNAICFKLEIRITKLLVCVILKLKI